MAPVTLLRRTYGSWGLLGANRSLGPKDASNDEGERRSVEQADSADEQVDSGGTDQKAPHDEGWSRVGPTDHGETADECRSNDEDHLRSGEEGEGKERDAQCDGYPTARSHESHRCP